MSASDSDSKNDCDSREQFLKHVEGPDVFLQRQGSIVSQRKSNAAISNSAARVTIKSSLVWGRLGRQFFVREGALEADHCRLSPVQQLQLVERTPTTPPWSLALGEDREPLSAT